MHRIYGQLAACAALLLLGCSPSGERSAAVAERTVYVAIPPMLSIVEAVAGPEWGVEALLRRNQDPHTLSLTPGQVQDLSGAAVYFSAGLSFEKALENRLSGNGVRLVFARVWDAETSNSHDHDHDGHDHHHEHEDPHFWLSPPLLIVAADRVREVLTAQDPAGAEGYEQRYLDFADRVATVAGEAREVLAPYAGRRFYVQHGAFEFLAEFADIEQVAIEAHGREPTPRHIQAVVEQARREGAGVIFIQPQQNPEPAKLVANAIGAELRTLDPLAPDPVANLLVIAHELAHAFQVSADKQP